MADFSVDGLASIGKESEKEVHLVFGDGKEMEKDMIYFHHSIRFFWFKFYSINSIFLSY